MRNAAMHARLRSILPHAVMLVAAVLIYWAATRIDVETGGRISPAAWPRAIVTIMALLCIYEIVKRLVARSAFTATGIVSTARPDAPEEGGEAPQRLGAMFLGGAILVAAYALAAPWLGFFASTALFLAVFPWVGGIRRPVLSLSIGLAGSLLLIVIFMRVAYISLPLGEGPFRALSLALLRAIGVS